MAEVQAADNENPRSVAAKRQTQKRTAARSFIEKRALATFAADVVAESTKEAIASREQVRFLSLIPGFESLEELRTTVTEAAAALCELLRVNALALETTAYMAKDSFDRL